MLLVLVFESHYLLLVSAFLFFELLDVFVALFHLVFTVFYLLLRFFQMALEIFDIFSLLSLRVIKALNVLFKIDDDLVFVLNLPLKILVLERKLSDGLLLGELGCVKSSVS